MQIETERLVLRPWSTEDAGELFRNARDPRVGLAAGWEPHKSVEDSLFVIRTVFAAPDVYAVVLKATGKAVGCAGLIADGDGSLPMAADEREVGYWAGVLYWGQGLIPEAVKALTERAFTDLGYKALWCSYYADNTRSARVAEKCGFVYHHTAQTEAAFPKDSKTVCFTRLTREEWEKNRSDASCQ